MQQTQYIYFYNGIGGRNSIPASALGPRNLDKRSALAFAGTSQDFVQIATEFLDLKSRYPRVNFRFYAKPMDQPITMTRPIDARFLPRVIKAAKSSPSWSVASVLPSSQSRQKQLAAQNLRRIAPLQLASAVR